MNVDAIHQGDSLSLKYGLNPAVDMSDWACRVVVKSTVAGAAIVDKTLTDRTGDNLYFVGLISSTDSGSIPVGRHWLIAEMSNSTTGENAEIHDQIVIKRQGID